MTTISIKGKIILLTGTGLALALLLSLVFFWSKMETNRATEEQHRYQHIEDSAQELQSRALEMRRAEKDFLLRKEDTYATQTEEHRQAAIALAEGLGNSPPSLNLTETASALVQGLTRYDSTFRQVVEAAQASGLDETQGAQGTLRSAVHAAEDILRTYPDLPPDLTIALLMCRRAEKDFLLRGDPKYLGRAEEQYQRFMTRLATVDGIDRRKIGDAMTTYIEALRVMVASELRLGEAIKSLSATYAQFEPLIGDIRDAAAKRLADEDKKLETFTRRLDFVITFSVIGGFLAAGAMAFFVARSIIHPIHALTLVMTDLSEGHRDVVIPSAESRDEIGAMARALHTFKEGLVEAERLQAEALDGAKRELARAKARDEAIEAFDGRVRGLLDDVVGTVEHVTEASGRLKGAAARTGERGNAVSEAASRTSGNVQTVATATEELSASTEEISQRVQESSLMSREAVETITETTNTVAALGETANRIGEVVLLIQAIASQTNLLALNATIESARAGEAGKGFAVVAHEVKALATQTSQATDEVQKRVAEIQTSTGSVTESIDRATKAIRQVDEVVTSIASAVEEQNAATKEIARNVQHVALANDLVTENMVDVASDARDTHLLAQDLGTGATSLHAKAGELNGETSRFLETIKAL